VKAPRAPTVVLVVEDEWLLQEVIAQELRNAGCEVVESRTAKEAIAHAQAGHRIDVVYTDIQLRGHLNGWDVAEAFRNTRADMSIIYTSGNSVDRSRSVPDSVFFAKPYDFVAVVAACRRCKVDHAEKLHLFLNIRDGETQLLDPEGGAFRDLASAKAEAITSARELISQCVLTAEPLGLHRGFEIADPAGCTLTTVPFSEAIAFD